VLLSAAGAVTRIVAGWFSNLARSTSSTTWPGMITRSIQPASLEVDEALAGPPSEPDASLLVDVAMLVRKLLVPLPAGCECTSSAFASDTAAAACAAIVAVR
jgi:hypothetical protein